jgi:hypothetical protein
VLHVILRVAELLILVKTFCRDQSAFGRFLVTELSWSQFIDHSEMSVVCMWVPSEDFWVLNQSKPT